MTQYKSVILQLQMFNILFVMLTGYLSLNTFLHHGIRRYFQKKVGNNQSFISLLKRCLIFAFFSTIYFVFSIYFLLSYLYRKETLMAIGALVFLSFFIFALRLTRVTFISVSMRLICKIYSLIYFYFYSFQVDNELSREMLYFSYLWISFYLIVLPHWNLFHIRQMVFPISMYFGVALFSYLYAFDVKNDFGKGLNEASK